MGEWELTVDSVMVGKQYKTFFWVLSFDHNANVDTSFDKYSVFVSKIQYTFHKYILKIFFLRIETILVFF